MANGLHTLKRMTARSKKRVGRGQSSGRGKTSGRGTKGQNARAGRKKRPELRDLIKKIPKRRGYGKNRGRTVVSSRPDAVVVTLARLESVFAAGSDVSRKSLVENGLITKNSKASIKIVGTGTLSKKLNFSGVAATGSARAAIEKAGGKLN